MKDEWTYHDYWQTVRDLAECVLDEYPEDYVREDAIHEQADGCSWVFVYHGVRRTLEHSNNADAWQDMGDLSDLAAGCSNLDQLNCRAAYWALRADLTEAVAELEAKRQGAEA